MKIVNCWWDEKITGYRSCEVIFNKEDKYEDYSLSNFESVYDHLIVKIPVGNLKLVHLMEDSGYRYLENQLTISFEVDQIEKSCEMWKHKLSGFTTYKVNNKHTLERLLNEVSDEMFENDRYSLDPFWKCKISSARYINWIRDMYEKGVSDFYIMKRHDSDIGFYSIKPISDAISSCPIAGIYNRYKSHGYFLALTWQWLNECRSRGNRKLIAAISSNNSPIHSFLSRVFSFRIDETLIVMRKVIDNGHSEL